MPAEVAIQPTDSFDPSSFDAVKWQLREHTAYITMSRPEARNALTIAMRNELMACFNEVQIIGRYGSQYFVVRTQFFVQVLD